MRRPPAWVLALPVVLAVAGSAPSPGAAQDRSLPRAEELGSLPIEISADRLQADSARNSVAFEGNVVAVQGDVTLRADRLSAEYDRQARAIEKISAEGNVRVLHLQKEARADRAVFFNFEQRIVLTGDAVLLQGENALRGETVTIHLRENRSEVVGGGPGGRVRAVIHPKSLPGRPGAEPR